MAVGAGVVQIDAEDWTVEALLGDDVPQYGSITSGFEVATRPKDRGFTHWVGDQPLTATIPLILDGYADSVGVERDRDRILKLAHAHADGERPDSFIVRGPVPLGGERVVCTGLDWGDAERGHNGRLHRQALTLTIMQWVPVDRLRIKRQRKGGRPNRYIVREGDTLKRIAARLKPHASGAEVADYAREIGKLNDIRDINRELNTGRELRLP